MSDQSKHPHQEYPLTFKEVNIDPESRLKEMTDNPSPIILLLDQLEDPKNLGAVFRLSDAARIVGIYGYQMTKNNHLKIDRVARQTTKHIRYRPIETIEEIHQLAMNFCPIALEYTNKSMAFNHYTSDDPCMLIIGNERKGVSEELLRISKKSLHVPMLGMNSSMNVSVATGIVLFHILGAMGRI